MFKVALKGVLAHKGRVLTTAIAVMLGVAFVTGTLVLSDTVLRVFDDLFADVPEAARLAGLVPGLPLHASELSVERQLGAMAKKNIVAGDVPFFLGGTHAVVEGIGERLTPLHLPRAWLAVVKPPASLATGEMLVTHLTADDVHAIERYRPQA